jgi:hypothetical protein
MKLREDYLLRERLQYRVLRSSVLLRCVMTQKNVVLSYFAAEAWNHAECNTLHLAVVYPIVSLVGSSVSKSFFSWQQCIPVSLEGDVTDEQYIKILTY